MLVVLVIFHAFLFFAILIQVLPTVFLKAPSRPLASKRSFATSVVLLFQIQQYKGIELLVSGIMTENEFVIDGCPIGYSIVDRHSTEYLKATCSLSLKLKRKAGYVRDEFAFTESLYCSSLGFILPCEMIKHILTLCSMSQQTSDSEASFADDANNSIKVHCDILNKQLSKLTSWIRKQKMPTRSSSKKFELSCSMVPVNLRIYEITCNGSASPWLLTCGTINGTPYDEAADLSKYSLTKIKDFLERYYDHDHKMAESRFTKCDALDVSEFFRFVACLSQAISIVSTGLVKKVCTTTCSAEITSANHPFVFVICSLLSCWAREKHMLEDAFFIWNNFEKIVKFAFVNAEKERNNITIEHDSDGMFRFLVSIAIPAEFYCKLCDSYADPKGFTVHAFLFNRGINHDAVLAQNAGFSKIEECKNEQTFSKLFKFAHGYYPENSSILSQLHAALTEPKPIVMINHLLDLASEFGFVKVLCCKSGKDRTAMASTFEMSRSLQPFEVAEKSNEMDMALANFLRQFGVRPLNCEENIGKRLYAFSEIQASCLPLEYRPPVSMCYSRLET